MSQLNVDTIKKADGTGNLSVPAETGTVVTTASPSLGRRNLIINGAMQVAQRGTVSSITAASYGGPDRFQINFAGGPTNFTLEQSSDAPANTAFKNSMRVTVGTGDALGSASSFALIRTMFEGQDLHRFKKGTTDAQQFWARSAVTGTHIVRLRDNDNSRNVSASYSIASANTWEYQQITFPADATGVFDDDNGRSLIIQWFLGAGSNYSSGTLSEVWASGSNADVNAAAGQVNAVATNGNIFGITGVQLEVGSVATPFEHRSYGEELLACSRYFQRWGGDDIYVPFATGFTSSSSRGDFQIHAKTPMRSKPTFAYNSIVVTDVLNYSIGASAVTSPTNQSSVNGNYVYFTLNSSGATAYRPAFLLANNSTSSFISLDAEL
jgi:hypothetical protein